jgi:muramidase (phage lysozyme)
VHHIYAPLNSELSTLHQDDKLPAIRELQNQLLKARFVDKLAKLAKSTVDSNTQSTTPLSSPEEPPVEEPSVWSALKRKGIALGGICCALSSLAAYPLGIQIRVEPLTQWVTQASAIPLYSALPQQSTPSLLADEVSDTPFLKTLDRHSLNSSTPADTVKATVDAPSLSPAFHTSPVQQQATFAGTLFRESTTPGLNSGIAVYDLPLEQQAFLMTIAQAEGATYTTIYGGSQFSDFSKHPHQCIPIDLPGYEGMCSDAAGKYQFLSTTWALLGLPNFSPENQDRGAVMLIEETHAFPLLAQGDVAGAFCAVGPIWASLPCNSYGQNPKSMETLIGMYESNLEMIKQEY